MGETLPITYIFKEVGGSHVYKNHVSIYIYIHISLLLNLTPCDEIQVKWAH